MMFAKKVAANPSESGVITESSGGRWGKWNARPKDEGLWEFDSLAKWECSSEYHWRQIFGQRHCRKSCLKLFEIWSFLIKLPWEDFQPTIQLSKVKKRNWNFWAKSRWIQQTFVCDVCAHEKTATCEALFFWQDKNHPSRFFTKSLEGCNLLLYTEDT